MSVKNPSPRFWPSPRESKLLNTETACFLNGQNEFLIQNLEREIGRQVEAIKTSMGTRECITRAPPFNAELSRPVGSSQSREPFIRNTRGSRDKLEKFELLLVVKAIHGLPKPVYDLMRGVVARPVVCVFLPVVQIDLDCATEYELELSRVKYLYLLGVDDLVEAFDKGVRLLLNSSLYSPFDHSLYVLHFVFFGDSDVATVVFQVTLDYLAAFVLSHAES